MKFLSGIKHLPKYIENEIQSFFENNRFSYFCHLALNQAWYFFFYIEFTFPLLLLSFICTSVAKRTREKNVRSAKCDRL